MLFAAALIALGSAACAGDEPEAAADSPEPVGEAGEPDDAEPEAVAETPEPEPEPADPLLGDEDHPSAVGTYDVALTPEHGTLDDTGEEIQDLPDPAQRTYTIDVDDPSCMWTDCAFEIVRERALGTMEDPLAFDGSTYAAEGSFISDCGEPEDPLVVEGNSHDFSLEFEVAEAEMIDGTWVATVWRGTALERVTPTAEAEAAGCPPFTLEYTVEAVLAE